MQEVAGRAMNRVVFWASVLSAVLLPSDMACSFEWSWSTMSQNGKFTFVCLSPDPVDQQVARINACAEDPPDSTCDGEIVEVKRLHDTYPVTGMYRNDGSTTPLWTTSEEVIHGVPAPDGQRLVDIDSEFGVFCIDVYDALSPRRTLSEGEIVGWVPIALQSLSDGSQRYVKNGQPDANWDHVRVT